MAEPREPDRFELIRLLERIRTTAKGHMEYFAGEIFSDADAALRLLSPSPAAAPAAETGKAQGAEALLRECEKVIRKLGHPRTCWYWRYDGMADDRRDINMRGDCDCGADALLKKLAARAATPEGEGK